MRRCVWLSGLLVAALATQALSQDVRLLRSTSEDFIADQLAAPRVRAARRMVGTSLRAELAALGIARGYSLYLRAFKQEFTLEVWVAAPGRSYQLLKSYMFCATSGTVGPKRRSGDGQIPEGFYTINRFNPNSRFHLSLGLDYPNAVDRARAGRASPGGDIFIHGDCVTIGCIPITDAFIRELYLLAIWARGAGQASIPVHIFPARPSGPSWSQLEAPDDETMRLWTQLAEAHAAFERGAYRRVPRYRATAAGYRRLD